MNVHAYERFWMWSAGGIVLVFLGITTFAAVSQGRLPPSHVETIDPQTVFSDPRFAQPGVSTNADGGGAAQAEVNADNNDDPRRQSERINEAVQKMLEAHPKN